MFGIFKTKPSHIILEGVNPDKKNPAILIAQGFDFEKKLMQAPHYVRKDSEDCWEVDNTLQITLFSGSVIDVHQIKLKRDCIYGKKGTLGGYVDDYSLGSLSPNAWADRHSLVLKSEIRDSVWIKNSFIENSCLYRSLIVEDFKNSSVNCFGAGVLTASGASYDVYMDSTGVSNLNKYLKLIKAIHDYQISILKNIWEFSEHESITSEKYGELKQLKLTKNCIYGEKGDLGGYIQPDVQLAHNVWIGTDTIILGKSKIGENCRIVNSTIADCVIKENSYITNCYLTNAKLDGIISGGKIINAKLDIYHGGMFEMNSKLLN
jgi:hypothetical protein